VSDSGKACLKQGMKSLMRIFPWVLPLSRWCCRCETGAPSTRPRGCEGAIGGLVSLNLNPALRPATAQIPGLVARISIARLEAVKRNVPKVYDVLARYADCLTAQVFQSLGSATLHPLEPLRALVADDA
jgi:hypothetical protein